MDNFVQPGHSVEYSNSGSAIESGDVVVMGDRCGVALTDIAATTGTGTVNLSGVYTLAKDNDEAISQGAMLYFDSSDSTVTATAAGNTPIGVAHEAATETSTSCKVRLVEHPKRAANVAALSQDISGTYSEAEVQAISTKVDAILTALKNAGIMKNA
jgi:predicted RecA/RadA family phage recombinase